MAANPVLVDSSYYIGLLRKGRDPLLGLAVISAQRDVATCGVVRCEVGRGLQLESNRRRFSTAWELMIYVPADNRIWSDAEELLWRLDRQGKPIPLTDAVIACCALRIGAVVLTFDKHFDSVPGLTAVERIV